MSTYVLISSTTVGSGGAAGIDFTSIPSTYTDLEIKLSGRCTASTSQGTYLQFNGSSSSIYSYVEFYGYSGGGGGYAQSSITNAYLGTVLGTAGTANTFSNNSIYIPNYAGNTNKPFLSSNGYEMNSTSGWQNDLVTGLWASTAAINRVYIYPGSGNFAQYTTAYLYGISNA
jgi:hypothetical protein